MIRIFILNFPVRIRIKLGDPFLTMGFLRSAAFFCHLPFFFFSFIFFDNFYYSLTCYLVFSNIVQLRDCNGFSSMDGNFSYCQIFQITDYIGLFSRTTPTKLCLFLPKKAAVSHMYWIHIAPYWESWKSTHTKPGKHPRTWDSIERLKPQKCVMEKKLTQKTLPDYATFFWMQWVNGWQSIVSVTVGTRTLHLGENHKSRWISTKTDYSSIRDVTSPRLRFNFALWFVRCMSHGRLIDWSIFFRKFFSQSTDRA